MRVRVDAERCVGHGRCYAVAPSVYGADDFGHCELLVDTPSAAQVAAASAGAANCPEDAITVSD